MSASNPVPIFRSLLGIEAFDALPATLRRLHLRQGHADYHGEVDVVRGEAWLSRLCGWATRLPPAGHGPIRVEIDASNSNERWTRHVGRHAMRSRLWTGDGLLHERLGLMEFGFRLRNAQGQITWTVEQVRVLGLLPLPAAWFHQVRAREFEADGHYRLEVVAALPIAGPLVEYRGWLEVT